MLDNGIEGWQSLRRSGAGALFGVAINKRGACHDRDIRANELRGCCMKRLPAQLALTILGLALLGAALHPLTLLLSVLPWDPTGLVNAMRLVREGIADLLGWAVIGAVATMTAFVAWERGSAKPPRVLLETNPGLPEASAPPSTPRVAVAITAYNDAQATADTVKDFLRQPSVARVLVIDNNSTDNTAEVARQAGAIVIREPRQGYGYACIRGLIEGLNVPDCDVIALTEGDGTFVADDLSKFLPYLEHADLVVGNRTVRELVEPGSQMDSFFTWGNMAVAFLLRLRFWDSRFLGPAGLSDVGCTFRAIKKPALARIIEDLRVGGMHFSPHMLLVALAHRLAVVEIPIRFRRRVGESKGASRSVGKGLQVGVAMIWHILTFHPRSLGRRPAVFVDETVVVNVTTHDRQRRALTLAFAEGATKALAALSEKGYSIVIVSCGARKPEGNLRPSVRRLVYDRIASDVEHHGGHIHALLTCSHAGRRGCSCRLPRPTLLLRAARRLPLDLREAVVISDEPAYLAAAATVGCRTVQISPRGRSETSQAEAWQTLATWPHHHIFSSGTIAGDSSQTLAAYSGAP